MCKIAVEWLKTCSLTPWTILWKIMHLERGKNLFQNIQTIWERNGRETFCLWEIWDWWNLRLMKPLKGWNPSLPFLSHFFLDVLERGRNLQSITTLVFRLRNFSSPEICVCFFCLCLACQKIMTGIQQVWWCYSLRLKKKKFRCFLTNTWSAEHWRLTFSKYGVAILCA